MNQIPANSSTSDALSLKEVVLLFKEWMRYLRFKWKTLLVMILIGGLTGFFYAKSQKVMYIAETTFVLEGSGGGAASQISTLASLVGGDLGGGGNGLFEGSNLFALYQSRLMLQQALLQTTRINGKPTILVNLYLDFKKISAEGLNFSKDPLNFNARETELLGNIIGEIRDKHLKIGRLNPESSLTRVQVRTEDAVFSKEFVQVLVSTVNEFYVKTKTKKSLDNLQVLQGQADSIARVLSVEMRGAAASSDAFPNSNPAMQILKVPSQRKQINIQAASAIYIEITKNLEMTKMSLLKETPLIQLIDQPTYPLQMTSVSKINLALIGSFCAAFITAFVFLIRIIIKRILLNG